MIINGFFLFCSLLCVLLFYWAIELDDFMNRLEDLEQKEEERNEYYIPEEFVKEEINDFYRR